MEQTLNLIDFALHKIQDICAVYQKYAKKTQWIGMSKMLHSILDIQKEHEKNLISLRQQGNLGSTFNLSSHLKMHPDNFFEEVSFPDNMNFINFLSMVILQQEEFIKLYECLGSLTSNREIQYLFTSFTEESRKQRLWALDRYELEILTL